MTEFEHQTYGLGFTVTGEYPEHLKRFKSYTRNGKVFWRDYNRNVKGGINMMELFEAMREKSAAAIIESISCNVYSRKC